jgi:hypothetical protein
MDLTHDVATALACGLVLLSVFCLAAPAWGADWQEVQELKREYLSLAAQHAMEQQDMAEAAPVRIPFPADAAGHGSLSIAARSPDSLSVEVTAAPSTHDRPASEFVRIALPEPMDMVARHSGLAFTVRTEEGTSPEVRLGCRLYAGDGSKVAVIQPIVPALSRWGDNPHEVYLDWSFLNYADVDDAVDVLSAVEAVEITAAGKLRTPRRGASESPRQAAFSISDLRLVDYLKGSYDPSRQWLAFDADEQRWKAGGERDLTLQHRCQEVTGIVALFGGDEGRRSAVDALDMAVRTQCWDGSFLDGRRGAVTVASGEFTFGFTIYGLLCGYMALEEQRNPALDEEMTVGPVTMSRREFCRRMFYRGAMARAIVPVSEHRDDIIGGNTLVTGANRVLGYAIAMRMVADALTDDARCAEVLAAYQPVMQEIADAQGRFSGGFPVLGEGDRYGGRGIHYDAGYVRTHMDWLVLGVRRTGDPLLVEVLRRYQTVFEAAMDERGLAILPLVSERSRRSRSVSLILPDATAQIGMEYELPVIAQWGYNCGMPVWENWEERPGNHFSYASHGRGYGLAAHTSILVDDIEAEPVPRGLGYVFPRQFPIWSSRLYTKDGELVRTSTIRIHPDGTTEDDFRIDVGEYPVTVGVPVLVKAHDGTVTASADLLSGWPRLLPPDAPVEISGDVSAEGRIGQALSLKLDGPTHIVVTGPDVTLPPEAGSETVPFRAELTLTPEKPGQVVEVTVLRGAAPE